MPRRRSRKIKRGRPRRSGKPRILILCEGTKTEPNYFGGFKRSRSLTSVVVRPLRPRQVGPTGLLKRVREELREDQGWDEIYCVLDHDGRDVEINTFMKELDSICQTTDSCRIKMILSAPCFELWLLLHFEFTNRLFATGNRETSCEGVIKKLQCHLPGYRKNDTKVFEKCCGYVDTATKNARKLQSVESPSHSSHTNVWQLIERLLEISGN